jgi:hypothetical protein
MFIFNCVAQCLHIASLGVQNMVGNLHPYGSTTLTGDLAQMNRKKNAPYLYDVVITHALDWPSLTCQWFPDKESYVSTLPGISLALSYLSLDRRTNRTLSIDCSWGHTPPGKLKTIFRLPLSTCPKETIVPRLRNWIVRIMMTNEASSVATPSLLNHGSRSYRR